MTSFELANMIKLHFGELITGPTEFRGEASLVVTDSEKIAQVCQHARDSLSFDFLLDVTSIDNLGDDPRWTLVYELYGLGRRCHLRLSTSVSEEKSEVPTVSGVWRTADWHEREIYDLMGIRFRGHPNLRRIIMWEGYPYFPLRKDFPLGGRRTDLPEVAFTRTAPLEGGPFVTSPDDCGAIAREPRARTLD